MLEFMFKRAITFVILLVLVANAVISEQTIQETASQIEGILVYSSKRKHLESEEILNTTFATSENLAQNQFCLHSKGLADRHFQSYKTNEFQVNVSRMEVDVLDTLTLKMTMNISGKLSCHLPLSYLRTECSVNDCTNNSQIITFTISRVTEKHRGIHILLVESASATYTVRFTVFVQAKPQKPTVMVKKQKKYVLECASKGYPPPKLRWKEDCARESDSSSDTSIEYTSPIETFGVTRMQSIISTDQLFHRNVCCCASNDLGKECLILNTQDLDSKSKNKNSALNVVLKIGEPFLVRCVASFGNYRFHIDWTNETKASNIKQLVKFEESKLINGKPDWIKYSYLFISSVHLEDSGLYTCALKGDSKKTINLTVIENGFINSTTENKIYAIGKDDNVCIEATLNAYPLVNCQWYFLQKTFPCELKNLHGNSISASLCNHGHKPGIYELFAVNHEAELQIFFTLYLQTKPVLEISSTIKHLSCTAESYPSAEVTWKLCTNKVNNVNNHCQGNITGGIQIMVSQRKEFGSVQVISQLDTSTIKAGYSVQCCALNAIGSICKQHFVPKKEINQTIYTTIGVIILFMLLLFLATLMLVLYKYKKEPGYERHLHMIQSVGPTDNDYIYVDFSHFDYDLKWEFPRENLTLGNILGSGAFGKVVEATAYGITKANVPVQVAVKMLKEKCEPSEKDAIMSELKMMIHMGNHENIMNLLGACTLSGPVYLIFEYCCYGDLLNYLRNNRETFHKTLTDVFAQNNFSFYHNLHTDLQSSCQVGNFLQNESYMPTTDRSDPGTMSLMSECDLLFAQDELTGPLATEETNVQNVMRYDDEDLQILTFEDLLSFSYQVARGMEFLASRNCIHRDLAARNVLVTHGKVAKICDFGLARDVMQDSNYVIKGSARLPVKWMAPESLFEGSYTIHSDIWSYGILLWEIFSLGVNPYPGIQVDAYFYKLIQSGFKMEQPFYANEEIYHVMQSCWTNEPRKRPTFHHLVSIFEKHLTNAEVALYRNTNSKACINNSIYKNICIGPQENAPFQLSSTLSSVNKSISTA